MSGRHRRRRGGGGQRSSWRASFARGRVRPDAGVMLAGMRNEDPSPATARPAWVQPAPASTAEQTGQLAEAARQAGEPEPGYPPAFAGPDWAEVPVPRFALEDPPGGYPLALDPLPEPTPSWLPGPWGPIGGPLGLEPGAEVAS